MNDGVRDLFVFFFSSRRRHTRFDCDWSSDVCSSDLDFRRRSGVVGVTGEEPPKAVPTPTERIHRGDAAVSPWLPSIVTMSEWARVCRTPAPITRLSAWVESEPTSTPTDAVHVQRGVTSYPASTWSAVALGASREDWAEAPERLRLASTARWACRGEIATPKSNPAAV